MFVFNENKTFLTTNLFLNLRVFLNKIKIPTAMFISPFLCFIPNPFNDLYVVVGKPLELPKIEKPTKEDVNNYH